MTLMWQIIAQASQAVVNGQLLFDCLLLKTFDVWLVAPWRPLSEH